MTPWHRSDLTDLGLGRALVHGHRPNHATLSAVNGGFIVTTKDGTLLDIDVPAWCAGVGRPVPEEGELRWVEQREEEEG